MYKTSSYITILRITVIYKTYYFLLLNKDSDLQIWG